MIVKGEKEKKREKKSIVALIAQCRPWLPITSLPAIPDREPVCLLFIFHSFTQMSLLKAGWAPGTVLSLGESKENQNPGACPTELCSLAKR